MGVGMGVGVNMVSIGRRLVMMMVVRVMGSTSRIAQISQINIVINSGTIVLTPIAGHTAAATATAAAHHRSRRVLVTQTAQLVPQDPRDGAHTGHIRLVADSLAEQSIADLPGKDAGIPLLQFPDVVDHLGRGHPRLGSSNGSWQDGARLMIPGQDLGHTAVAHSQLAGYVAGSDAQAGQLHDPHPGRIRQRTPIDEDPAQLVHLAILRTLRLWVHFGR